MSSLSTPSFSNIVFALVLREMESIQAASRFSLVWALLEPILGLLLLSIIFMVAFPAPPIGESFALFYACGLLPIMFFQDVSQKAAVAVRFSRPLLGFACVSPRDLIVARLIVATAHQTIILFVVMCGLTAINGVIMLTDPATIGAAWVSLVFLSAGFGFLGCWLGSAFPVWPKIWAVLLRPLVLLSGVFFLIDEIATPYREWLLWNPLVHIIARLRGGIYGFYNADYASLGFVTATGLACLFVGLIGLTGSESSIIDEAR